MFPHVQGKDKVVHDTREPHIFAPVSAEHFVELQWVEEKARPRLSLSEKRGVG